MIAPVTQEETSSTINMQSTLAPVNTIETSRLVRQPPDSPVISGSDSSSYSDSSSTSGITMLYRTRSRNIAMRRNPIPSCFQPTMHHHEKHPFRTSEGMSSVTSLRGSNPNAKSSRNIRQDVQIRGSNSPRVSRKTKVQKKSFRDLQTVGDDEKQNHEMQTVGSWARQL